MALILALGLTTACDKSETQKGSVGETCQKRDDCGGGLSCIDNRCVDERKTAGTDGGTERIAGGKIGESCTRRGDCQAGLACFDQVCMNEADIGDAGLVDTRGDRGETCTARNDCRPGLACVNNICRQSEQELTSSTKQCFRVDCQTAEDCCVGYVPPSYCQTYKASCDLEPGSIYCDLYETQCSCRMNCVDILGMKGGRQCTTISGCGTDDDCFGSFPFCVNTTCVECKAETDCANKPGTTCVGGTCREPCTRNEQCPLFFGCQSGQCVDVGCMSDRECAFANNNPRSKCVEKKCSTPCETDAECMQAGNPFNACEDGRCVFVGCETNEECRALLGYQGITSGKQTAVCKMPDP